MGESDEREKNQQATAMIGVVIREGARIMTAMVVIVTTIWWLGKPALLGVVDDYVRGKGFVTQAEIATIQKQADKTERELDVLQADAKAADGNIAKIQTEVQGIKELLTEQRSDIKALLRQMRDTAP